MTDSYNARDFKVGDILDGSFHYTAKIPYFYKVVRRTPAMVFAVRLGKRVVSDDGYGQNGSVMPNPTEVGEKIYKGRITKNGYLRLDDCLCSLWDGKPVDFWSD